MLFTYANEAMESRVRPLAEEMNAKMIVECDVTNEEQVKKYLNNTKNIRKTGLCYPRSCIC